MQISFPRLTFDDIDGNLREYSIDWEDSLSPGGIIEFIPASGMLYMPHTCTDIVIFHEAQHILFDYCRYMNSTVGMYPFDEIKGTVSAFHEENIISFWGSIVGQLFWEVKHQKYDFNPF